MSLRVCNTCHKHLVNTTECLDCLPQSGNTIASGRTFLIGALLGLGLTGCGEKDEDTAAEPSSETEPDMAALYGEAEPPPEED
mgnify:CR=1 FL=1